MATVMERPDRAATGTGGRLNPEANLAARQSGSMRCVASSWADLSEDQSAAVRWGVDKRVHWQRLAAALVNSMTGSAPRGCASSGLARREAVRPLEAALKLEMAMKAAEPGCLYICGRRGEWVNGQAARLVG